MRPLQLGERNEIWQEHSSSKNGCLLTRGLFTRVLAPSTVSTGHYVRRFFVRLPPSLTITSPFLSSEGDVPPRGRKSKGEVCNWLLVGEAVKAQQSQS